MQDLERQRPLGVWILSILLVFQGLFLLILGITLFFGIFAGSSLGGLFATVGIMTIIIALLVLYFAWSLWTLKRWAFWATVIIEMIYVVTGLVALFMGRWVSLFGLIISAVILIYFLADANVRAAFRT